jgi:transposase
MEKRRVFSSAFKSQVVLESLKERETLGELSVRYGIAQEMISRWKSDFIKRSKYLFDDKRLKDKDSPSKEITSLRTKVGQLTMERDFLADACKRAGLKKKLDNL